METLDRKTADYWLQIVSWIRDEKNKKYADFESVNKVFLDQVVPYFQSHLLNYSQKTPQEILNDALVYEFLSTFAQDHRFDQTRPTQDQLTTMLADAQQRVAQETEVRARQHAQVQKLIRDNKIVYLKEKERTLPTVLDKQETGAVLLLAKQASTDNNKAVQDLSKVLLQKVPEEIKQRYSPKEINDLANIVSKDILAHATKLAGDISESGVDFSTHEHIEVNTPNTTSIFLALAKIDSRKGFPEIAKIEAEKEDVVSLWTTKTFGRNIEGALYGRRQEYVVSDQPSPGSIKLNLQDVKGLVVKVINRIYEANPSVVGLANILKAFNYSSFFQNIPVQKITSLFSTFFDEVFTTPTFTAAAGALTAGAAETSGLLAYQFISPTLFSNWEAQLALASARASTFNLPLFAPTITPQIASVHAYIAGPFSELSGQAVLLNPGTATLVDKPIIQFATKEAVEETAKIAGAKAATEAGIATAAGTGIAIGQVTIPVPVVGALIGLAISLASKVIEKVKHWIQTHKDKFSDYLAMGSFGVLLFGITSGSVFLTGSGSLGVGLSAVLKGPAKTAGSIFRGFGKLIRGLGSLFFPSIAVPFFAAMIIVPVLVALILFIINSGAYVVPPANISSVEVEKTIDGPKEFENSDLASGITVNYTITITSHIGSLSSIAFTNECKVIREGFRPTCDAPLPTTVPEIIDASTPYTFDYSVKYSGASFEDSLVIDTFKLTAVSSDNKPISTSGSAHVIIGNPPTACLDFQGFSGSNLENLVEASFSLSSDEAPYMAQVCSLGDVPVVYNKYINPGGWGYFSGGTVYLNGGGLSNPVDAKYILAHELGHYLSAYVNSDLLVEYKDTRSVISELPLCSYSATGNASEGFAEAIALYATHDESSQWNRAGCGGIFKTRYPNNWQFVNDKIY